MRNLLTCLSHTYWGIALLLAPGVMIQTFAQNSHLTFTNYTINDGLSDGLVNCVTQDQQGFIWFGTSDGLDRFDGYEFRDFYHNPFDSTSLSDNSITALFSDSRGQLWIGTLNGGINLLDRWHNKFLHFLPPRKNRGNATDNYIKCIAEDKKGNLWLAAGDDGLYEFVFSGKMKGHIQVPDKVIHYAHQANDAGSLVSN
ncbi:MAG: ligand-binding sensor domain-containing protein, partial [Chitinophagaceae bacterium]